MAVRGAAARRYADAVLDIARDNKTLDAWLGDLKTLVGVFGSPDAVALVEDPKLTEEVQREMVGRFVPKGVVSELALNLLHLLLKRRRLALLPRILEHYQELYDREMGIVLAEVTTAVPLDEAQQRHVAESLSRMTGKDVRVRAQHDPTILGGMITRIGDTVVDASVASRLAEMGERLS